MNSLINNIKGIGASPGIAIGKAMLFKKVQHSITGIRLISTEEIKNEIQKFEKAVKNSVDEVETIKKSLSVNSISTDILEVQTELLQDAQIATDVIEKITSQYKNANDAVIEVIEASVELIKNLNEDYLSARSADLQDVGDRLLKHLNDAVLLLMILLHPKPLQWM